MAISSYTELQTAVGRWLQRNDLASMIPDFIALAEAEFNRRLRASEMLVSGSVTIDDRLVDMPSRWLETRSVTITNSAGDRVRMEYATPEIAMNYTDSGTPQFYTIIGTQLGVAPPPDATYAGEMVYWEKLLPLASNPTNWLLDLYPDLYLYRSVYEGAVYTRDIQLAAGTKGMYEQVLSEVNTNDGRRQQGVSMTIRAV